MIAWMSLFALLDGAALTLAFSPFNVEYASYFLMSLLLFVLLRATSRQAILIGLLFGFAFFGTATSWVYISIHQYGNASALLAAVITFLFVLILALFPTILCYLFRRFFSHMRETIQCLVVFPILWTAFELLRVNVLTGFPWLLLGYTQLHTPLSGLAPIIGVYGLSWATVVISGAIILIAAKKSVKVQFLSLGCIIVFFGLGWIFDKHNWTQPIGKPFTVSIVQGNIPQETKWDTAYAIHNINVYKDLTLNSLQSKLVVWPEGAMPVYANELTVFIQKLGAFAKNKHSNIIFGVPIQKNNHYYNGALLIGDHSGEYLKKHLVPFGEYTPFKSVIKKASDYFKIPMSDFDAGPVAQPLFTVDHASIAPFICYEIAFPLEVWRVSLHSNVLLTLSDDSWFGKSIALAQHLQMAQMRSIETGQPQLVATNTGISAFISPLGKVIDATQIDKQVVITQSVQPMTGKTPLMRIIAWI